MIYSSYKTTSDIIVETLATHNKTALEICDVFSSTGTQISVQSIYDALRILIKAGVVIKQKKVYSLSAEWRKHSSESLLIDSGFPKLEAGDHLSFTFHSYVQLDQYWKHINALLAYTNPHSPIFFYVSHQIWIYLQNREKSQDTFLKGLKKEGREGYTLVGNADKLDQVFKKNYEAYLKIELEQGAYIKEGSQLTVCGDFVVITKLPKDVLIKIDMLYKNIADEGVLCTELQKLFSIKQRLSVTIYNDKQKARRLKKRIIKDMYIPKKERDFLEI